MYLRDSRGTLQRAGAALVLCAVAAFSSVPVLAQPGDSRGRSYNASDRARLATSAPGLMTLESDVSGDTAPGLARAQQQALGRAIEFSHGRQSAPGGRGNRIVRLPRKLATSEAFAFGYSPGRGLVPAERPNGGGRLLAVRDEHVDIDEESYGWVGRIFVADDPTEPVGTISLVYHKGGDVLGSIQVRTDRYRIEPLGNRLHVLIDVDEDASPARGSDPKSEGGGAQSVSPLLMLPLNPFEGLEAPKLPASEIGPSARQERSIEGSALSSRTQRILVLYTSDAAAEVNYISSRVNEAIMSSNSAYGNSVTSPRIQLAHQQILIGFSTTENIVDDVENRIPGNSSVRSLRDSYKADLVVMITERYAYPVRDLYGTIVGYENGRVKEIFTPGVTSAGDAFAVVNVNTLPEWTFTHEVGHLQGAQHHPDDGTSSVRGYSYGRGHREIWSQCFYGAGWICGYNRFATIMAYEEGAYRRVAHISNPDVEYQDRSTGTSTRDNARALDNSATTVAAFRPDPLSASISGPSVLAPFEYSSWTASAIGGPAGVPTYRWYKNGSFTGVTSQTYSTEAGYSDFSIRVDIVRGNESASASKYVTVFDNGGCDPDVILCPGPDPGGFLREAAPEAFALQSVDPNPLGVEGTVAFDVPGSSNVVVAVYDVLGREVARPVDGEVGAGTHRVRFDASQLSPGVYVVRMQSGTFSASQQFTVAR